MLCLPPKSTLLKASCNKQLESISGLTYNLIAKYLPPSTATGKGHMVHRHQGLRLTRLNCQAMLHTRKMLGDMTPAEQACKAEDGEMFCFAALADQNRKMMYNGLAGRFLIQSFSGMNYIFVAHVYSIKAILIQPLKSRSDACMVAVLKDVYQPCGSKGIRDSA